MHSRHARLLNLCNPLSPAARLEATHAIQQAIEQHQAQNAQAWLGLMLQLEHLEHRHPADARQLRLVWLEASKEAI